MGERYSQYDDMYDVWEDAEDKLTDALERVEEHNLYPKLLEQDRSDVSGAILSRSVIYDGSEYEPKAGRVKGQQPTGWEVAKVSRGDLRPKKYATLIGYLRDDPIAEVRGEIHKPVKVFIPADYDPSQAEVVFALLILLEMMGATVDWRPEFR